MTNEEQALGVLEAVGVLRDTAAAPARNATLEAKALAGGNESDLRADLARLGIERADTFPIIEGFFEVSLPDTSDEGRVGWLSELARRMSDNNGAFRYDEVPSESVTGASEAADPAVFETMGLGLGDASPPGSTAWALDEINAPKVWAAGYDGAGVRVGVIDTGWADHPETDDCYDFDRQRNFVGDRDGKKDAADRFSRDVIRPSAGHGTLVASVCASRGGVTPTGTDPALTVTGAAPAATLVPIRAIRSVVDLRQTRLAAALAYAAEAGPEGADCDVIAMALGGPKTHRSVEAALRRAAAAGIVTVCAAGNIWPLVVSPARLSKDGLCCAVAAVTHEGGPWRKTAKGPTVTVSAPGAQVWGSRVPDGTTPRQRIRGGNTTINRWSEGTTLATALTAGLAALWVQSHGGRKVLRARASAMGTTVQALFNAAVTHGLTPPDAWRRGERGMGAGIVDAQRLLDAPLTAPQKRGAAMETFSLDAPMAPGPSENALEAEREWRRHHAAVRERLTELGATPKPMPEPSPSLAAADGLS